MAQAHVWTQNAFHPTALAVLDGLATVETSPKRDAESWYAAAAQFDAMIIGGLMYITGDLLDTIGPRLRVIGRPGIGVDRIDLAAATERGVQVVNTPDGPTESTAEHAVALLLALTKGVVASDRILRSGSGFPAYGTTPLGLEAQGAALGLIGLGRIGGRVAEVARVLGMHVVAFDPLVAPERAAVLGVELAPSLGALLAAADVVSVHCPSIPETFHLINSTTLAQMRRGSYLINVSRGPIIDEGALVDALRSGHLAGAGLDVFDPEPAAADNPLFSLPNTVCTAHIGSYTAASVLRMQIMACEQVAYALRGERPPYLVNNAVWGQQRV